MYPFWSLFQNENRLNKPGYWEEKIKWTLTVNGVYRW